MKLNSVDPTLFGEMDACGCHLTHTQSRGNVGPMTIPDVVTVTAPEHIFPAYRDTPIALLLEYQNLKVAPRQKYRAQLLVVQCMDNRTTLRLPDDFAFVIRTAAGSLRHNEFRTAFALSVGDVRTIALIGHTDCGMVQLSRRREQFIDGMVRNAGWTADHAGSYFDEAEPTFEIQNEVEFIVEEARRVRALYPAVLVAPLIFQVETKLLAQVREQGTGNGERGTISGTATQGG